MKYKGKGWEGVGQMRFKGKRRMRRALRNYARFVLGGASRGAAEVKA